MSVTSIGNFAFCECTGLISATIGDIFVPTPNPVSSIGEYAFQDCSGLESLTIGNSVTSIGDEAFDGCSSLLSITIGNSLTSIGSYAFSGCREVMDIYAYSIAPPSCDESLTYISKSECTLHVRPDSFNYYREADEWKYFYNIVTDISGVDTIADDAEASSTEISGKGIYAVDGVCVAPEYDEETFSRLPSGLYIVNGKKVVKK